MLSHHLSYIFKHLYFEPLSDTQYQSLYLQTTMMLIFFFSKILENYALMYQIGNVPRVLSARNAGDSRAGRNNIQPCKMASCQRLMLSFFAIC